MLFLRTEAALALMAVCVLAGAGLAHSAAADHPDPADISEGCHDPLCLNASHLEGTPNHLVLHEFDIVDTTRGSIHVKGDLAEGTGRDSKNSAWVLTGHVQVFMPQGHLSADRATMQIVGDRITVVTARGSPAEFESSGDTAALNAGKGAVATAIEHARGHADEIVYSLEHDELQLNGNSWLSNGCNEISSQHISYDIASQKVHAENSPGEKAGVQMKVRARTSAACSAEAEKQ